MEGAHSITMVHHTAARGRTHSGRLRSATPGLVEPGGRLNQRRGRSAPRSGSRRSSPGGELGREAQGQKQQRRCSQAVLETITVRLFQDEDNLGPRLKPDEEYVSSLINMFGDVIRHDYKREKISPDNLPPQAHLKIWGVCPPASKEDKEKGPASAPRVWSKEELRFLISGLKLENKKLS